MSETPRQKRDREAANTAAGVPANVLAEAPHWDARLGELTVSDELYHVDYEWTIGDHGDLVLRRTVWTIAHRRKDQHIAWMGDVATIYRKQAPAFVADLVSCLSV